MKTEVKRWGDHSAGTEAASARAKVSDGEALQKELIARADRGFARTATKLQKKYQAAGEAFTKPLLLDVPSVKSREDLQARLESISAYITVSKELRDFIDNGLDIYRRELSKHKLTPETRTASSSSMPRRYRA